MKKLSLIVIVAALFVASCKKEETPVQPPLENLKEGVFIVNQGTFTAVNATLSYYESDGGQLIKGLFNLANGTPLGDVAQSITMDQNYAWIVVNNSGTIHAINKTDAKLAGTITGLTSPRYMLLINENKAYVSDFFSRNITIVNPSTFEVSGEISSQGRSTEKMVLVGNDAYVANWSGFNQDPLNNTILVVDTQSDQIVDSIKVGVEPNSMVVDVNNDIWVLCSGGFDMQTKENATLWRIDPATREPADTLTFEELTMYPSALEIGPGRDSLYFLNIGVYKMGINEELIPEDPFIVADNERTFGYLSIDPNSGDIYISDPLDYVSSGRVYRYSSTAKMITTMTDVGIVPAAFGFNEIP
jgi:hypothetical protein